MKKVLILAYDFPPFVSVGGLRPYNWFKYLNQFDIHPVVITRQWSNTHGNHLDYISPSESPETIIEYFEHGTVIRTPYSPNLSNRLQLKNKGPRIIQRLMTACYEFAQYPINIGTKKELFSEAKRYLENNEVDLIIATGDPFVLFKYANSLSKNYQIPWIADYRDLWSQNPVMKKNPILRIWSRYFEKQILKNATHITTVSEFLKVNISEVAGQDKKISIITNGYDLEAIEKIKNTPQEGKILSIGFAGSIYQWHPLQSFLAVANEFVKEHGNDALRINFYGTNVNDQIAESIESKYPNLKGSIQIYPRMSNSEVLHKLAENNLMLLFNDYCFMGTKIYDYIGAKRTILFCYSDDSESKELKERYYQIPERSGLSTSMQSSLIEKLNLGTVVKDRDHLKETLNNYYSEFAEKGTIKCESKNTNQFSRESQTKKLAELIHELVKN